MSDTSAITLPNARLLIALVVLSLAACASRSGSTTPTTTPATQGAGATPSAGAGSTAASTAPDPGVTTPVRGKPPVSLGAERKYLAERFAGTPVTIDLDLEGALVVEVPLKFAFDAGSDRPKPALKKVLDYVATSLRRVTTTRFATQSPADTKPDPALAERRAKAVSAYLVTRAVNVQRADASSAATEGGIRIRIVADKSAP